MDSMYQVKRAPESSWMALRHCRYHLLQWGPTSSALPPLVLCHGWMDVGQSWQFMVDALSESFAQGRRVLAFDWRGYGLTESPATDCYWFPDYLADLDVLLDTLGIDEPIDLVGHSMGGNVVMMYAGTRPERIRRLVNIEGFGMSETRPSQAPTRLAQWLDELKGLHRGEKALKDYADVQGVAERLMKTNPRLGADKALWLAQHWARPNAQGRWQILGDPAHKIINPYLSRLEETLALYARISAPVMSVVSSEDSLSQWWRGKYTLAQYQERLAHVPDCRSVNIDDCGHMLHHDQPQALAEALERFLLE